MNLGEKLGKGMEFINKNIWIVLVPVMLDVFQLFAYQNIFKTVYVPVRKIFAIKIGFNSAPPSVQYILDDFPSVIFKYGNNTYNGIINEFSLFNVLLIITYTLIMSFINGRYMYMIGKSEDKPVSIKEFFKPDNKLWFKFFILQIIDIYPFMLMFIKRGFISLAFVNVIFVFVRYSFVADDAGIRDNFKNGISFLFNNLGLAIRMALYYGLLLFSILSIFIFLLTYFSTIGIIIDIIIVGYFGCIVNKAVLEVYRSTKMER
jgi:hypothetical protein